MTSATQGLRTDFAEEPETAHSEDVRWIKQRSPYHDEQNPEKQPTPQNSKNNTKNQQNAKIKDRVQGKYQWNKKKPNN